MHVNFRIALAVGCAGLLAMSGPANSRPLTHGAQHKLARHNPPHRNATLAIRAQAHRHAPPADASKRAYASSEPIFGWPSLVSEARKYIGTNPTARKRLWCATFMNFVLAKAGYTGTHSDAAKSFAYYGHRVSEPKVGAIAVLSRGNRGGHVGVVSGIDSHGNPIIISGNHNRRVGESVYPRARVIAYVMPTDHRALPQIADRGSASRPAPAGHGIDSPIAELLAAINAEQERSQSRAAEQERSQARARPVARPPQPPVPHRTVQQLPDRPQRVSPRPAPQRQQRVEQPRRERVALAAPTDRR